MGLLAFIDMLFWVAVPVLTVLFIVMWVKKKPKAKFGIAAMVCAVGIIICSFVASDVLKTEDEYKAEIEQLKATNEELSENLKKSNEIAQEYLDKYSEEFFADMDVEVEAFTSLAKIISEDSVCVKAADNILQITIPLGSETIKSMDKKVADNLKPILLAFSASDTFDALNIVVVDGNGVCVFGVSVDSELNSHPYLTEVYKEYE